jgi:hypothetical protein
LTTISSTTHSITTTTSISTSTTTISTSTTGTITQTSTTTEANTTSSPSISSAANAGTDQPTTPSIAPLASTEDRLLDASKNKSRINLDLAEKEQQYEDASWELKLAEEKLEEAAGNTSTTPADLMILQAAVDAALEQKVIAKQNAEAARSKAKAGASSSPESNSTANGGNQDVIRPHQDYTGPVVGIVVALLVLIGATLLIMAKRNNHQPDDTVVEPDAKSFENPVYESMDGANAGEKARAVMNLTFNMQPNHALDAESESFYQDTSVRSPATHDAMPSARHDLVTNAVYADASNQPFPDDSDSDGSDISL